MLHGWWHLSDQQQQDIADSVIAGKAIGGPYHMELHPTNRCNAQCHFCCTVHLRENESLTLDQMQALLEQRDLNYVRIAGGGEPLLHPNIDTLFDLCAANLKGLDIITNGILLSKHADHLVRSGCEQIHVSLNEPTEELYAETMRIDSKMFGRAVEGLRAACESRDRHASTQRSRVTTQMFISAKNHREIRRMCELAIDLGVDYLDLTTLFQPASGAPIDRLSPSQIDWLSGELFDLLQEDIDSGRNMLRFQLAHIDGHLNQDLCRKQFEQIPKTDIRAINFSNESPRTEYCQMPFYSTHVSANGDVATCCILSGNRERRLGNVHQASMPEIWRGDGFQKLRQQMRQVYLLRGRMNYRQSLHGCLSKVCMSRFDCHMNFGLATPEFYQQMTQRMDREFKPLERIASRGKHQLVDAACGVRDLIRSTG